jgi:hypothetical protein
MPFYATMFFAALIISLVGRAANAQDSNCSLAAVNSNCTTCIQASEFEVLLRRDTAVFCCN